jgi:hypothetical protein
MSQGDAEQYLGNQYGEASFSVMGDDPEGDRVLASVATESYTATPDGLRIRGGSVVANSTLDEDNTFGRPDFDSFPENRDEFYADIRLHYLSTGMAQTVETCRLSIAQ